MINQYNIVKAEADNITEPVTLAEAKAYMGVDYVDFDDLIEALITFERESVEEYCALALVQSTVSFNVETTQCKEAVTLPYVSKAANVVIKDEDDNVIQDYRIWGNILRIEEPGAYQVSYDTANLVPKALKHAIQMLVAYRFNHRGDEEKQQGIPMDIQKKLDPHRILWL